jgi:hypothetical protein
VSAPGKGDGLGQLTATMGGEDFTVVGHVCEGSMGMPATVLKTILGPTGIQSSLPPDARPFS